MSTAIVFGGYGVFGVQVVRELAQSGITVTVAGRNHEQAEAVARQLGSDHAARQVDLASPASCREALRGQVVAVNCAGSLVKLGGVLLDACLQGGCHYTDISVERDHAHLVCVRHELFRRRGLTAVYGCSSLPALSGALALQAHAGSTETPTRARVTLFIGNRNPKGRGAITSLVQLLGQPIRTPQGIVLGFRERTVVPLPAPFGRRAVFNFDGPEYDLFPKLLAVRSVEVKVGFELRLATYGFALLACLGLPLGGRTATLLERLGGWLSWLGSSGGVVMAELFYEGDKRRSAALLARREGQRMAALPCALVARTLCEGSHPKGGVMTAYEFLGAQRLLQEMVVGGFELIA